MNIRLGRFERFPEIIADRTDRGEVSIARRVLHLGGEHRNGGDPHIRCRALQTVGALAHSLCIVHRKRIGDTIDLDGGTAQERLEQLSGIRLDITIEPFEQLVEPGLDRRLQVTLGSLRVVDRLVGGTRRDRVGAVHELFELECQTLATNAGNLVFVREVTGSTEF